MIIKEVYVKNFGKLKERHMMFGSGINLIAGSNESGKTTLHMFLKSMLYGVLRMRGRAAQYDEFHRYEPWGNEGNYAGVLRFESGDKVFRLTRNFYKGTNAAELICETDGEKLDVEQGDLKVFLGGISESVFQNTFLIGQLKSLTDQGLVDALRDYVVNYQESRTSDLDIKGALNLLKNQRKELERQIKEEKAQLQIKIRGLESQIAYVKKEQKELQEKLEQKFLEDHKNLIKPKRYYLYFSVFFVGIGICLLGLQYLAVGIAGVLSGVFAALHYHRLVMKWRDFNQKHQWYDEQLKELLHEKQLEWDNLYGELKELKEQTDMPHPLEEDITAISLAMQTIEKLSKSQQRKIGDVMQKRMSQILSKITDGKYIGVHVSEEFQIHIDTKEAYVVPEQLSRGTLEQIYFAFRMAAGEILCQDELLPIILDDVFVMYDEKRLVRTLQWLSDCGHQVLLFSCHKRERYLMDQFQIPYQNVMLEDNRC